MHIVPDRSFSSFSDERNQFDGRGEAITSLCMAVQKNTVFIWVDG